jgi:molecular chaperone GrpE
MMAEDQDMNEKEEVSMNENVETEQDNLEAEEDVVTEPTWEDKYNEMNEKFLRLYAEFDNYRRRTNKEKIDLIGSATSGVMKEMIPVMDDFERAIENNKVAEDIELVKEGFGLIYNKFRGILEAKGLKVMESKGQPFDSDFHEAIANVPAPSESDKGKVIDDVEKGYLLNEKVVRFAKVVVGQ